MTQEIYNEAFNAGCSAVAPYINNDGYPCGFAWVQIKPARGPFVSFLKKNNIGRRDEYFGGWLLRSSEITNYTGQNMEIKELGAKAFANVLNSYGINAFVKTRID